MPLCSLWPFHFPQSSIEAQFQLWTNIYYKDILFLVAPDLTVTVSLVQPLKKL